MADTVFWDKIAPKYALSPISDPKAYAYTLDRTRSYLSGADRVLELGCGTGSTALLLAGDVGHMTATDLSPEMIAIARNKPTEADNITFAVQDAAPQEAGFDAILAFNLFHLVPDMEARFRQIHTALAEGGVFISKTPCIKGGIKGLLIGLIVPVMRAVGKAPYVRRFTVETLENAIVDAGFDIIESGSYPAPSRYVVARKRVAR